MRKNAIRENVINTASRLFYKQGYNGTGINQIIDEAGVAKSSLYQNYRSKEDLLADYLHEVSIQTNNALRAAVEKFKKPKEKAMAMFDFLLELVQQKEYHGCNFLNIISEIPEENTRIRHQIKTQKDYVRNMFREILEPIGKEALADELYILFEGALITNKVHNELWSIKAAKNIADKLL